jgi:hypothetical protein
VDNVLDRDLLLPLATDATMVLAAYAVRRRYPGIVAVFGVLIVAVRDLKLGRQALFVMDRQYGECPYDDQAGHMDGIV